MTAGDPAGVAHLYVHLPFCASRCGYCAFVVEVGREDARDAYLDAVLAELARERAVLGALDTVYLGGGTPTLMGADRLARLLGAIAPMLAPGAEGTVEANPETMDDDLAAALAAAGVTLVSLGAQSSRPHLLEVLDRRARPGDAERAARAVDPAAAVHFPPEGLGRLAVVELRAAPAGSGASLPEALLASLPGDRGAADLVIVRDAPPAAQDLGAHLAPWAEAFFLLASNADFWRDMVRRGRRVAVDATRKRAGEVRAGLPIRAYPPLVAADAATAALVDRRWAEYGFDGPPVPTRRVPS